LFLAQGIQNQPYRCVFFGKNTAVINGERASISLIVLSALLSMRIVPLPSDPVQQRALMLSVLTSGAAGQFGFLGFQSGPSIGLSINTFDEKGSAVLLYITSSNSSVLPLSFDKVISELK
jgi:hypothetical protein